MTKIPNNWRLILFEIWILTFGMYLPNFTIRWCLYFVISDLSGLGLSPAANTIPITHRRLTKMAAPSIRLDKLRVSIVLKTV